MEQLNAVKLALHLASTGETHQDYERVVKMADKLLILITGENIGSLLIQFVQRESAEMFEQRLAITSPTTPAIANSLMQPFDTVGRNDKIKKRFDYKDETKNKAIQSMIDGYFGSKRRKNARGLEYWIRTRFKDLVFSDPNSWIVDEWTAATAEQIIEPHPFEVTSREAVNFKYENEELKWLFVKLDIEYYELQDDKTSVKKTGLKYTLYDEDFTIVICRVCKKQMSADGIVIDENTQSFVQIGEADYLLSVYEPKLGYVPAFPAGYIPDLYTKGRTYVSPLHPALTFFMKSLKTVSEMDLSMTLHAFPQKLQYVQKCMGESRQKTCHNGYVNGTVDKCGACKGTGYKMHTTGQDAILLPMPDDAQNMIPLEQLLVYKSPPIDLIKFQDEYTKGLKLEAHLAVFNSTMFVNPNPEIKTATEVNSNVEGAHTTLFPYTEKVSEVYKERVHTFALLAAVTNVEDGENIYQYPADLKLKTTSILLGELKAVNESGAPSFMRDAIGNDLAELSFKGDELGYKKYQTRHKFFPFNGKTPDEIAMLMSSQYVSEFTKVLYSNFESIFTDIEIEKPGFSLMNSYAKQWTILEAKVHEYIEELKAAEPVQIDFGSDTDPDLKTGEEEEVVIPGAENPGGDEPPIDEEV